MLLLGVLCLSADLVKNLGGGSILDLSPCDLLPYLRGRTLWLIGDSHSKTFYRALQCFLIDFWDHTECQASPQDSFNAQLLRQPVKEGLNNCIHLLGDGGGRICMVEAVLGTNLVNNTEVSHRKESAIERSVTPATLHIHGICEY
jgi:hypothetical protein